MSDAPTSDIPPTATEHLAPAGPRIRWAAIVWGLAFAAIAAGGVAVASSSVATATLTAWVAGLEVGTIVAVSLLTAGALLMVAGVAGLLRRTQLALARARTASTPPSET